MHEDSLNDGFVNDVVDVSKLPSLDPADFVPLDRNYLKVSLLAFSALGAVATMVGFAAATQVHRPWVALLVLAVVLLLVVLSAALRVVEVRYIAYQVRSHDMSFRRGVISRRVETLPFNRVQHASIKRGPLERLFGLATLHVNSAGPNLAVPGLRAEDAERLKAMIVERAGVGLQES